MQASTFILSAVSSLLFVSAAADEPSEDGASWPQWHGPARNGVSTETDWTPGGKALWETEVGLGYSSVVVQDGRLYTMGYNEEFAEDLVWCLDALTGEEVWVHPYPAKIWNEAHRGGTVNTPTVEGDAVYSLNREGNLFRLDAETGEVLWHVNITEEHGVTPPRWGFSASPVVYGEHLYWVNDRGVAYCVNAKKGELVYQKRLDGVGGGGFGGRPFYASITLANDKLYAVSRTSGTFVFAAKPEFQQLALNRFASDKTDFNASPAISDGQMILRSNQFLYCVKESD